VASRYTSTAETAGPFAMPTPVKPTTKTDPSKGKTPTTGAEIKTGAARVNTGGAAIPFGGLAQGGGGAGGVQLDVKNFCCPEYLAQMVQKIRQNWNARQGAGGQPTIKFTIRRDGMLTNVELEKASGQDYFTYVREHVYKPAGMNDTDAFELDHDTPNLAMGYTSEDENGRYVPGPRANNLFSHVVKGGPAGGGFSTAPDLLKFTNALVSDKLVGRPSREILTTGKVVFSPGTKYGYGFICSEISGRKSATVNSIRRMPKRAPDDLIIR